MFWKPIFILVLSFAAFGPQTPHLKTPAERRSDPSSLPQQLTEAETQSIKKEQNPKPHVDATLRVSDARINSALRLAQENHYKSAAEDVDLYAALIVYADAYTRKLPGSQHKDRNACLKKVEQAVFKQTRTIEAVLRELPVDYREPAEEKITQVKKIRLRAINDLLGGGQVINSSNEQ
jgi:hypothetical protein